MSKVTPLSELASFVGKSPLSSTDENVRQNARMSIKQNLMPKTARNKVSDLIDIVIVRSAQTRRKAQQRVEIDLDVFAPDSTRAVLLSV